MKLFLVKLVKYLLIPTLVVVNIEALLPINTFTSRLWEATLWTGTNMGRRYVEKAPFYPNLNISMTAVGDLCHHTENEIPKYETMKTDKLGFRNDIFMESPDIVIIGDSFIGGSGLAQDETLTMQISKLSNNKLNVYSIAPSTMNAFDYYFRNKVIKKPKILVYSIVERALPIPLENEKDSKVQELLVKHSVLRDIVTFYDKIYKFNSLQWIRARISESTGGGIPSPINNKMYFYQGKNQKYPDNGIEITTNTILSYKKYCDSLGIKFVFLPLPNKETIYYEYVPFRTQPNYLFALDSSLRANSITTINSLQIFNNFRLNSNELIYHYDDTHWNKKGVSIIADTLYKKCLDLL